MGAVTAVAAIVPAGAGCGRETHAGVAFIPPVSSDLALISPLKIVLAPRRPTSDAIFRCSRCHEGGAADPGSTQPHFPHATHESKGLECDAGHPWDDDTAAPTAADPDACAECHDKLDTEQPDYAARTEPWPLRRCGSRRT